MRGGKMLTNELNMSFNYEPITYGQIKSKKGNPINKNTKAYKLLCEAHPDENSLDKAYYRKTGNIGYFNDKIIHNNDIMLTIRAAHGQGFYRYEDKTYTTDEDVIHAQTFPEDYDFCDFNVGYVCGMSVPPVMIKRIVTRLIEQGVYENAAR